MRCFLSLFFCSRRYQVLSGKPVFSTTSLPVLSKPTLRVTAFNGRVRFEDDKVAKNAKMELITLHDRWGSSDPAFWPSRPGKSGIRVGGERGDRDVARSRVGGRGSALRQQAAGGSAISFR